MAVEREMLQVICWNVPVIDSSVKMLNLCLTTSIWHLETYAKGWWGFGLIDLKLQQEFLDPQLSFLKNQLVPPVSVLPTVKRGLAKSSLWQSEEKMWAQCLTPNRVMHSCKMLVNSTLSSFFFRKADMENYRVRCLSRVHPSCFCLLLIELSWIQHRNGCLG